MRPFRQADIDAAVEIVEQNYPGDSDSQRARRELAEAFKDGAMKPHFLACEGYQGELLGFGGYIESWMDYHLYELFWINVRPERQGQGVGTLITNALVQEILNNDPKAKALIGSSSHPGFYKKLGSVKFLDINGKDYIVLKVLSHTVADPVDAKYEEVKK